MDSWSFRKFITIVTLVSYYINVILSMGPFEDTKVLITSSSNIKYLQVPTSDDPVLTWMEVQKGQFPDITKESPLITNVIIGEPITLFIFFKDNSNLYKMKVTECWAHDNKTIFLPKHKLQLWGDGSKRRKVLTEWKDGVSENNSNFLYTTFTSFKFPDKDQVYFTCNVEMIGKDQTNKT